MRTKKLPPIPRPRKAKPAPVKGHAAASNGQAHEAELSYIAPALRPFAVLTGDVAFLADNPREHTDKDLEQTKASLRRWGQVELFVVNRRPVPPVVLNGNGRLQAALSLGWSHVAVHYVDLADAEAKLLAVQLNRTGEMAGWHKDHLDKALREISTLTLADPKLDEMLSQLAQQEKIAGFGQQDQPEDPGPQIDRAAELQAKWKTERGQLWVIPSKSVSGKEHRLLCGDSTQAEDVGRVMGGEKAGICFTDPPYGAAYDGTNRPDKTCRQYDSILKNDDSDPQMVEAFAAKCLDAIQSLLLPGGVVYLFGMMWNFCLWRPLFEERFKVRAIPIWVKDNPAAGRSDFFHGYEIMMYGTKQGAKHKWRGGRGQSDVWRFANPNSFGYTKDDGSRNADNDAQSHPTQKPTDLVRHALELSSDGGDLVADPFLGSGTTMIAAEQTGRVCYGIELEAKYVGVALERLAGIGLEPRLSP